MGLDRVHLGGGEFRAGQGVADDPLLRGAVRRGQPVGLAVLVHRGAAHHREHLMPEALGITEAFQQQQPDAFGPAGPVRRRGECLAAAVGGQAPLPGELHEPLWRGHHCHPAGQRQAAFTRPQRPRGQMQRYQGRRAGRVHGYRRALETEGVGDPARRDTARVADAQVAFQRLGYRIQAGGVILPVHAGEDPGVRSA